MHSRIEDETLRLDSAERGIEAAFRGVGPALLLALGAACIGFLVLHLSSVPMIRDFGSMLAAGAVMVFVISVALTSGIIYLRERTRLGPRDTPHARFEVERLVGGLTARTVGRLAPIALVAVVVALGGLYMGRKIPTQTDPEKFVTGDSSVLKDLHYVRDVSGSTDELDLLVETQRWQASHRPGRARLDARVRAARDEGASTSCGNRTAWRRSSPRSRACRRRPPTRDRARVIRRRRCGRR